ncbi:MAG: hypothetical protein HRT36_01860 [Alphaproteobacteria bacterium]|nr:hypothetical protein [Alphaproteobacteria bacterium]
MIITRRHTLIGLSALSLGTVGCTSTPMQIINPPSFRNLAPLNLDITTITTELLHDDRAAYPHVEGLSPYPLQEMVQRWLASTINTAGSEGQLNVQIIDASMIEEKLKKSPGLSAFFIIDQSEAYHGHIQLLFQITYPDYTGEISMESHALRSVAEDITLRERQQTWVDLGAKMINDIDQKLRFSIQRDVPRLLLAR